MEYTAGLTNYKRWIMMGGAIAPIPVIWFLLAYFGVELGFVVAPTLVLCVLAYRIHTSRLTDKTRELVEANRIHLATVEALATAIDARDQISVGHVRRTQIYAVGLGRLLGLPASDIDALRTAALLHDIGKLAVPDHILNKEAELTPAELEKTKIHSAVGAAILEKVGFETPVVPTVRFHHEAWDGSGYPQRLTGEKIPLTARILSIADAFDSMRCDRPYRPALTREDARQALQREAGRRFDPALVNVLLCNLAGMEAQIEAAGLGYENSTPCTDERQNYVEQIKLANREVFSLYELAREFSSAESLDETLDLFARKIREFVPLDTAAIYLLNDKKHSATAAYTTGVNAAELKNRVMKPGNGATGYALKMRECVQNVEPDLDFLHSQTELAGQYSTMASVPLIADDELIGAVTVYACELEKYDEEDIRLLETISRIAADAIGKSLKHDEARSHALTDPMTGLPNARSLQTQYEKEAARVERTGSSLQLLMLDLDGFKAVNDSFGHKVGDQLLRSVGQVIASQLRDYDFLARYGGDEFVALIPEASSEDVNDLSSRIEKAVSEFSLEVEGGGRACVGVSLGSSSHAKNGESFDQMVVAADKAMYSRKMARKRAAATRRAVPTAPVPVLITDYYDPLDDTLIVELDETHVVTSAIN